MEDNKSSSLEQMSYGSSDSLETTGPQVTVTSYSRTGQTGSVDNLEVHDANTRASQVTYKSSNSNIFSFSRKKATIVSAVITAIVVGLTGVTALVLVKGEDKDADKSKLSGISAQDAKLNQPSSEIIAKELQGTEEAVLVNGDLITKGLLKVVNDGFATIIQAQGATTNQTINLPNASGTLCLDNNNCNFVTQDQIASLSAQLGQIVIPTFDQGVDTLNGQKGAISIQGVSNQISVVTNGTVVTLATPQDIAPISSPTFSSLLLNNNFTVSGTINTALNCTGNLNGGLLTTNGSGQIICGDDDGGAAGVSTPGGTIGRIALFTGAQTIADSIISEALGTITITGSLTATGGMSANSLSLSTALGVASGGTGAVSFTSNGVLIGNGSGAIGTTSAPIAGQVLLGNAGGVPVFVSLNGDVQVSSAGVTSIQANSVDLGVDTTGNYVASLTAGNGISVGAAGEGATPTVALTALTANWNQTGAFDLVLNNASSELRVLESAGATFFGTFDVGDLTADRTYTFPDSDGTVCLDSGNCVGSGGGAPNSAGYLTVGNDGTLSGERAITAGTNLSATDGGANGLYTLNVVNNPSFSGLVTANAGINLGSQTLQGTNAVIDFTNFDVSSAGAISGNSLTLATALSVANGGTGRTTLTTNGVLYGAGASGVNATLAPTSAQILVGNAGGTPVFVSMSGDVAISNVGLTTIQGDSVALGTDTTGNYVASLIAGSGISVGAASEAATPTIALASLTADWSQSGAFDIVLNNASSELKILESNGGTFYGSLDVGDLTADRIYTFPDIDGTVCLDSGNCVGSGGGAPNSAAYLTVGNNATLSGERAITAGTNLSAVDGGANSTYTFNVVSNPTFAGFITANGGVSLGTQTLQGTTAIIDFSNFDVDTSGNILSGTLNGQVISSTASFTGSLAVATDLTVNGNVTIGNASSDTLTLNGTIQGGTPFILEGATANAHQITIAVEDPTADRTYRIPFVGANADFCLSSGNCAGSGGGVTTSGGTTNRVAKFTGSQSLGDSTISDDGTNVSITGDFVVQGGNITFGTSSQSGSIVLHDGDGETVTLNLPDVTSSYNLLLPNGVGTANQCLKAQDGTGTLFWDDCVGGSGSGNGITTINSQSGPSITINNATGSGNAITLDNAAADGSTKGIAAFNATNFTASTGVINTVQNINTGAAPSFAGLTLTGNLQVNNNTIQGGTAVIDFTNFDVSSGGAVTAASLSLGTALSVSNGGTGVTTLATNGILYGNGTGAIQVTSAAANSVLITNGSNVPSLAQTLPSAVQGNITTLGTITSGVWNGSSILDAYVSDTLTVGSAGTVDWTALNNYPAACAAGQAITQLGDTITCATFASGSGSGNYIQNQNASQQASANFWISGTGRADASILTPTIDTATLTALNIGTTNAQTIVVGQSGVQTSINGPLFVTSGESVTFRSSTLISTLHTGDGALTVYKTGNTVDANATTFLESYASSSKALVVRGNSGQSANIFEVQDASVNVLAAIGSTGGLTLRAPSNTTPVISLQDAGGNTTLEVRTGDAIRYSTYIGAASGSSITTAGSNTGVGYYALKSTSSGGANTAIGYLSLQANTTGEYNTALGAISLDSNTTGSYNVSLGAESMHDNTSGSFNIALGYSSLRSNTSGQYNNALGFEALLNNTTGSDNIALGSSALRTNSTGDRNIAVGRNTLYNNTTGIDNAGFGYSALLSNTTGSRNVAFGSSLQSNTTGGYNVALGYGTLNSNVSGNENVAIGSNALLNSTSSELVAIGADALLNNTTGVANTAVGYRSLRANSTGNANTALGVYSLLNNTTGDANTALGVSALFSNTTGSNNTAIGSSALYQNTTGQLNVAVGSYTLNSNISGAQNTAVGYGSLGANSTGSSNVAVGYGALGGITTGSNNTALGNGALGVNTTGGDNLAVGASAGGNNATGIRNTFVGTNSGYNSSGSGNIFLGYDAGFNETVSNRLYIENSSSTTPLLYGEFDTDFLRINGRLEVTQSTTILGDLTVGNGGKVAFQRNTTDITATGTITDLTIGNGALFRFNGASAQTLSSIADISDGRLVTIINAAATPLTIQNNTGGTAGYRIITGTGSDISLQTGATITLVYDSSAFKWRVVGGVAGGNGTCSGCANTSLSNLSSVSINASLIPNANNTLDLGSSANSWRTLYADTSVLTPSIDTAAAGTLSVGNTNATTINIATNAIGHTINIGTGNNSQTVNIGTTNASSYLSLQAGSSGVAINSGSAIHIDFDGQYTIGPFGGGNNFFGIDSATGDATFTAYSKLNAFGSASYFDQGIELGSAGSSSYTTPLGASLSTRIKIPNINLSGYNTLLAFGLPSGADANSRALLVADARTTAHQVTIGVISPNESDILGFSWEGSNTTSYMKTLSAAIGLRTNTTDLATFATSGISLLQNTSVTGTLGVSGASTLSGGLVVTNGGNVAFQRNTTNYTATGTQDNVNFGTGALFRITSASPVTINGIAGGTDGRSITLMNASANTVTLGNNASGTAANHIITGTGGNIALLTGASIHLMYDSSSNVWRVISSGSGIGGGSYVTLQGTTPGTADTGNLNISGTGIFGTALKSSSLDVASAGTLSIGTTTATSILMGNNTTTTLSVGQSTATNTINIGNGNLTTGTQTINIGTGVSGTAGSTLSVGSNNDGSTTTIRSGTGGTLLSTNGGTGSTAGTTIQSVTNNSTNAFRVQNSAGANLLQIDTTNNNVTILGNNAGEPQPWSTGTALTTGAQAREETNAVYYNGYIYIPAGDNGSTVQTSVAYIKVKTDGSLDSSWAITGSSVPTRTYTSVAQANGYIYIMGGASNVASTNVNADVYYAKINADGTVGTFAATQSLPAARKSGAAVVLNGYMYYVGGDSSATGTPSATTTVYYAKINPDGTLGAWATTSNALPTAGYGKSGVAANGYIYYVRSGSPLIYYVKPSATTGNTTGAWSTESTNQKPGGPSYTSLYVNNGYLYEVAGEGGGIFLTTVSYSALNANGSLSPWSTAAAANQLPAGRSSGAFTQANGYMYYIGGYDGSAAQASAYYTSLPRLKVGGALDLVNFGGEYLSDGRTGGELTAGSTKIIGTLEVNDMANFLNNVSIQKDLTVGGSVAFKNASNSTTAFRIQDSNGTDLVVADTTNMKLTVQTLEVALNLTVNGHIISGGTAPGIAANTAACTSPTVSLSGTDTAGTITVTTGTSCGATGDLVTITFNSAFGAAPRVVMTPASSNAVAMQTYVDSSVTSTSAFRITTNNAPTASQTYRWYYHVIQ